MEVVPSRGVSQDGKAYTTAGRCLPRRSPRAGQVSRSGDRPSPEAGLTSRLDFLDALRGIAALAVFFAHAYQGISPAFLKWQYRYFEPGQWGVFVFFLISGYIVPVSLERHGSLVRFWIGRICRLYPLYCLSLGGAILTYAIGFSHSGQQLLRA